MYILCDRFSKFIFRSLVILRTTLRRVLHSILLILEANYPDTFDEVRRDWGFQKESY